MNTFTSITYTQSIQNGKDNVSKLEYTSSVEDDGKLINTTYNNTVRNNDQTESFNRLLKNKLDLYEQVGSSQNKNDWIIKEFHNSKLNKEYKDEYNKHNFDQCFLDCLPKNWANLTNQARTNKLLN